MKVAINTILKNGPWGGGNRFVDAIAQRLSQRGDRVVYDLKHEDIDLIIIVDPRKGNPQVSFSIHDIISYLDHNPRTIVLHRINECDERKNTFTMNWRLRLSNRIADHTVFIASWLKDLNVWVRHSDFSVILNGASEIDFPRNLAVTWKGNQPLRIVTHHWGGHQMKGWDVYLSIDKLLNIEDWRKKIYFTYIGNIPKGLTLKNINLIAPLNGIELSKELSSHHVYISASQNEPAGMHHIEGAVLGLPILYRRSGALPEYCTGFGESFKGPNDIEDALYRMLNNYPIWKYNMQSYKNTANKMVSEYLSLIDSLIAKQDQIFVRRKRIDFITRLANRILL